MQKKVTRMLLTCRNAMACISATSKVDGFCDRYGIPASQQHPRDLLLHGSRATNVALGGASVALLYCISATSKVDGFCDRFASVAMAEEPTKKPFEEKKFI
jgi:hypothetical protein